MECWRCQGAERRLEDRGAERRLEDRAAVSICAFCSLHYVHLCISIVEI